MARKYKYRTFYPDPRPGANSPVMDGRDMEDWLNELDKHGWELVCCGGKYWQDRIPQIWWMFRRPFQDNEN